MSLEDMDFVCPGGPEEAVLLPCTCEEPLTGTLLTMRRRVRWASWLDKAQAGRKVLPRQNQYMEIKFVFIIVEHAQHAPS